MNHTLTTQDPLVAMLLDSEKKRQQNTITLIASENYASGAVREAQASLLSNKYAEGYPGKRYYAGCSIADEIEMVAQERCKKLFKADYANMQPHAGSQANMAVYHALIKPGDTLLGMSLSSGGHLTHGHTVSFSGSLYNALQYGVDKETELIDYNQVEQLAEKYKPKIIIAGASAYSQIVDFERFAKIAQATGAYLVADIAHIAGLIATDLHPSPVGLADCITSTTHKTLRGPRGAFILARTEWADSLDKAVMPGLQGGPMMHTIAAKAVAFELALQPEFKLYQKQVLTNAQALSKAFISRGYRIVSGGTENHLFTLDLTSKKITGLEAEKCLESIGITTSRSTIPFDTQKPWIGSGIRLGTPAVTTRGMKEADMENLAEIIDLLLSFPKESSVHKKAAASVTALCAKYPLEL